MAELTPRKSLPPLLLKLNEVKPERLDYLGVSFGATSQLFKFWKKCGFVPVYMRQTQVRGGRLALVSFRFASWHAAVLVHT